MAYQQRDNSGLLSRNRNRKKDTHPEFSGECTVAGQNYYISGWVKDGKYGSFFSLSFKPKEQNQGYDDRPRDPPQQRQAPPPNFNDLDDDIPF